MAKFISQVQFDIPFGTALKSGLFSAVSSFLLLFLIYYYEAIKNIGSLDSLYLPAILVTCDFLKCSCTTNIRFALKDLKWIVLKSSVLIFISLTSFFILAILYGVPAFTLHEQTFMFSVFITTCTTLHCLINMGFKEFNVILAKKSNSNGLQVHLSQVVALASIFGCWSASIVIPLDWDRWWQKWPIPSIMGTMIGYTLGHFLTVALALYNIINIPKKKCRV